MKIEPNKAKKKKKIPRGAGKYLDAIKKKCIDCCGGQSREVKLCPAEDCPLWKYRQGRNYLSDAD